MWERCPVCSSSKAKPTARLLSPTPTLTSSSAPCAVSLMPAGYPKKQNDILWNRFFFQVAQLPSMPQGPRMGQWLSDIRKLYSNLTGTSRSSLRRQQGLDQSDLFKTRYTRPSITVCSGKEGPVPPQPH